MDFNLDEDARTLQTLAADVLGGGTEQNRWKALAKTGLLGACLPAEFGGAGLGAVELAIVLREAGAHAAVLPAYATLALGAMPIAAHGTAEQKRILAAVVEGEAILTGAPREPGDGVRTTAVPDGDDFVLTGIKTFVPYAAEAQLVLVPAATPGGVGVFLVPPDAMALSPHPAPTDESMSRLRLDGVRVPGTALLGGTAQGWPTLHAFATAGAVASVAGALAAALALTTEHVKTRRQFGRALAELQAVTMEIGDVYIAKRALDVAMWAGVWRLANGRDDTEEVLAIAAFTACDSALKAFYTCQHLHGGLGLDVTYPLGGYFACAQHYSHILGGAEAALMEVAGCSSI